MNKINIIHDLEEHICKEQTYYSKSQLNSLGEEWIKHLKKGRKGMVQCGNKLLIIYPKGNDESLKFLIHFLEGFFSITNKKLEE